MCVCVCSENQVTLLEGKALQGRKHEKVLVQFMENSWDNSKAHHSALLMEENSHTAMEVSQDRAKLSHVLAASLTSCWVRAPILHKLIMWPPSSIMDSTCSSGSWRHYMSESVSCQWLIYAIPVTASSAFFSPSVMHNPEQEANCPPASIWLQCCLT